MEKKTIVIAGTKKQFRAWCALSGINPLKTGCHYIYAGDYIRLRGIYARDIILVGTYYERKDYYDVLKEANRCIR